MKEFDPGVRTPIGRLKLITGGAAEKNANKHAAFNSVPNREAPPSLSWAKLLRDFENQGERYGDARCTSILSVTPPNHSMGLQIS